MDIKGKVIQVLSAERGQGKKGEWIKQTFVVETPGQYPKKIAITKHVKNPIAATDKNSPVITFFIRLKVKSITSL